MLYVYLQDHEEDNYHDGTHDGKQYFPGRGRFIELKTLQPDRRVVPSTYVYHIVFYYVKQLLKYTSYLY